MIQGKKSVAILPFAAKGEPLFPKMLPFRGGFLPHGVRHDIIKTHDREEASTAVP